MRHSWSKGVLAMAVLVIAACPRSREQRLEPEEDGGDGEAGGDADADLDSGADAGKDSGSDAGEAGPGDAGDAGGDAGPVGDADGDRIPDDLDPDPETPGTILFEDDFSEPRDDWVQYGWGKWGVNWDETLEQGVDCHETWGAAYAVDTVSAVDVYAEVSVYIQSQGRDCGDVLGAGLFVRRGDDDLHACMLRNEGGRSRLTLLRLLGRELKWDGAWLRIDWAEAAPLEETWVTIGLVADGTHLTCRVEGIPELWTEGRDATPAEGTVGLITKLTAAYFDDFLVVELTE